jgi:hypothetical protein
MKTIARAIAITSSTTRLAIATTSTLISSGMLRMLRPGPEMRSEIT